MWCLSADVKTYHEMRAWHSLRSREVGMGFCIRAQFETTDNKNRIISDLLPIKYLSSLPTMPARTVQFISMNDSIYGPSCTC
jgi:hypothetical protein